MSVIVRYPSYDLISTISRSQVTVLFYSINRPGRLIDFFGPWEWALVRGGRLFEAERLLNFQHFQQVQYVYFATKQ